MEGIVVNKNKRGNYVCEACDFIYKDKEWAEKCETFCMTKRSCSLEITKHAIKEE
jgi:hypothetical protein